MKVKLIILSILTILLFSCGGEQTNEIPVAKSVSLPQSLLGNWYSHEDSSLYIETWNRINDSLFFSDGVMLKGTDTLFAEKVEIKYGKLKQYIPQVNNQNGGEPVVFTITQSDDSSFTAENPEHDFPQLIHYQLRKDSLIAYIEGKNKAGKLHREYFRMGRK